MKKINRLFVIFITLSSLFIFSACEENEASAIAAAQQCLNEMNKNMTSAELTTKATECRSLLGTATSTDGFIIQCSSFFLEESFFGSKILEAFNRVDDDTGAAAGNNDVLNLASTFAFKSTDNASTANTACQQTGLKTFKTFGDLAVVATTIGAAFGTGLAGLIPADGSSPTLADFETALGNLNTADTASMTAIGSAVASLGSTLCSSESNEGVGADTCSTLDQVTSGASSEVIGQCMVFCMADGNKGAACPQNAATVCP